MSDNLDRDIVFAVLSGRNNNASAIRSKLKKWCTDTIEIEFSSDWDQSSHVFKFSKDSLPATILCSNVVSNLGKFYLPSFLKADYPTLLINEIIKYANYLSNKKDFVLELIKLKVRM